MPGPLADYRIVDCTAMNTGPLATMILADQGAGVVKIEPPGIGDVMRQIATQRGGMSAFFAGCNRSKRSAVLDLRQKAGRALQPDLIYVSLNAFGETGPFATRPAYDHIIQGMSGMAAVQGVGAPAYVRNTICDKVTAYTAVQAITAALLARERGHGGQHVRLSMLDASLAFLWPDGMSNQEILEDDVALRPPLSASYVMIQALDGLLSIAVVTDAQWHGLFRAVGRPDLIEDARFTTAAARSANRVALLAELGGGKVDMRVAAAISRFQPSSSCGVAAAVSASTTPAAIGRPAPALGEHTAEVLGELGLSAAEIDELRAKGVVD